MDEIATPCICYITEIKMAIFRLMYLCTNLALWVIVGSYYRATVTRYYEAMLVYEIEISCANSHIYFGTQY